MSASQELLQFFSKSSCSVLQLSELRKWYQRESGVSLQALLQELVDSGAVQCRTVPTTANGVSSIYWLRTDRASATPSKLGTPMSVALRERLKRSRPKFVSPLLSTKRPKMVVACGESPVGRLTPPVGKLDLPAARLDFSRSSGDLVKDEAPVTLHPAEAPVTLHPAEAPVTPHPAEVQAKEARQQLLEERSSLERELEERSSLERELEERSSLERELEERSSLERELEERLERRRKLQMVRMYHTKNDLCQLSALTNKWRGVAQDAVEQLLVHSSLQPPPSMAQLLSYLHIDPTIIHYSPEEESFY